MKTVKVKPWGEGQGDYVIINLEDFDAEKHELIEEDDGKMSIEEIRQELTKLKINFDPKGKKADLRALLEKAKG